MLPLAIIISLGFVALVLGVSGYSNYVRPGLNKMKKDILAIREELHSSADNLIDIDKEELRLLSSKISKTSIRRRITKKKKGYLTSIYDENLVAYAIKKYMGKDRVLIYARTKRAEFVFIKKKDKTQFYLNGNPVGQMVGGDMYHLKEDNKLIGQLKGVASDSRELTVGGQQLAVLNPSDSDSIIHPRAFKFLAPLNPSQKKIVMAIVIHNILKDNI